MFGDTVRRTAPNTIPKEVEREKKEEATFIGIRILPNENGTFLFSCEEERPSSFFLLPSSRESREGKKETSHPLEALCSLTSANFRAGKHTVWRHHSLLSFCPPTASSSASHPRRKADTTSEMGFSGGTEFVDDLEMKLHNVMSRPSMVGTAAL